MTEIKKVKVAYRAVEARIKRHLLKQNCKFKKKGYRYFTIDLDKGEIQEEFNNFTEMAEDLNCIEDYEEIEFQNIEEISINELTAQAVGAAMKVIDSKLGVVGKNAEGDVMDKIHPVIFEYLNNIKKLGAHSKEIKLID